MLHIYRFFLSAFVAQAHLWDAGSGPLSYYAVFSFYVLSGFLMTLVLNETYGFSIAGFVRFWANRLLRLYPIYFLVAAITVLYIVVFEQPLTRFANIGIPESFSGLLANITMFGIAGFNSSQLALPKFVPSAWSLSIEMFSYLLLSLLFARSLRWAVALLIIGLVVTGAEIARVTIEMPPNYDFQNHYGVLQAGFIPFALGSIAYFCRKAPLFVYTPTRLFALIVLWTINVVLAHVFDFHRFVSGLYAVALINVALVPMLFSHDLKRGISRGAKLAGDLAYPIFVSHVLVGTLLVLYFGFANSDLLFFLVAMVATILFSFVAHAFVEERIEIYRRKIKQARGTRDRALVSA